MTILTEHPEYLLLGWLLLMSLVLFLVMGRDKRLAAAHRHRISEASLFLLALAGGALGGVLGMQIFRHKTQYMQFVLGFPAIALLQWVPTIWLLLPD